MTGFPTVDEDLATLRAVLENAIGPRRPVPPDSKSSWLRRDVERINGYWDTVARVEAELSRLREERDAERASNKRLGRQWNAAGLKLEAAEARCARLTEENERLDGLRALYLKSADEWSERCARLQQALRERHRWLLDALSRNQIVHETDRARARAFIADWEALAGPGSEQGSLTESGSAGLPDTPADEDQILGRPDVQEGLRQALEESRAWGESLSSDTPADSRRIECDGGPYCKASPHTHGCLADKGDCDHPSEHADSQRCPRGGTHARIAHPNGRCIKCGGSAADSQEDKT